MPKKTLCFFTNEYPYGNGESFIENELNFIAPYFETVYLFHKYKIGEVRQIPVNVKLIYIDPPINWTIKQTVIPNFLLLSKLILEELVYSRQKKLFRNKLKYNIIHILNTLYYSTEICKKLNQTILTESIFYSYWFFDWNFSLSILKYKGRIKNNISRAHGFDLYEDNGKPNYLPSRNFCLQNTDKIFAISKVGQDYLSQLYAKFSSKIKCSYLGTKNYGLNIAPESTSPFHIVSCSSIIAVKRLHLLIDILKNSTMPIIWTHIGDGILRESIVKQSKDLPLNIKVVFKGSLSQQDIFSFYKSTPIDVFINCSESEGIPISIMEAISFGIPIIATDVGGVKEIVNSNSGILIKKDFIPKDVAIIIDTIRNVEKEKQLRNSARQHWEKYFTATSNYSYFIKELFNNSDLEGVYKSEIKSV